MTSRDKSAVDSRECLAEQRFFGIKWIKAHREQIWAEGETIGRAAALRASGDIR